MADRINDRELITLAFPNTKPELQANCYTEHQLVRRFPSPPSPSLLSFCSLAFLWRGKWVICCTWDIFHTIKVTNNFYHMIAHRSIGKNHPKSFVEWLDLLKNFTKAIQRNSYHYSKKWFIYLFIYSFIYLYPVKNSSGKINSNTMTNILKPRNLSPNIILTYNMLLKKTWFPWMPCLKISTEKAFKLI